MGPETPPPCVTNTVELELTISRDGVADSQVIPVRYQGTEAYLAIDTGAPLTFVFGGAGDPEYLAYAGDVEVGCETYPVSLLTLEAVGPEPFGDKMIIGIVGMDFFSEVPSEIDYPGRKVVRHLDGVVPATGVTELPVEWNGDRVLVDAAIDDQPLRLIYDAGSAHTIWVGEEGRRGDEEVGLGTADGSVVTVYEGTSLLDFAGDEDRPITVWRAPTFPYLERELDELDAQGLLGATGMGFRRLVFALHEQRMLLGPLEQP
jgi:hypothetical protein